MAEGGSERIGGLHIEVTAVGADKAAQQVGAVAGAVDTAGKQAAASVPKMAAGAAAVAGVGTAAATTTGWLSKLTTAIVGVGTSLKTVARSVLATVGWVTAIITAIAALVTWINDLASASEKASKQIADNMEATRKSFQDVVDGFADQDVSGFERAFKALVEQRRQALAAIKGDDVFSMAERRNIEGLFQAQLTNLIEASQEQRSKKAAERRKKDQEAAMVEKEKEDRRWLDSVGKYWDEVDARSSKYFETERKFLEFVAEEKAKLAREHTAELEKQRAIIQGAIDAQTAFARQFNQGLNIEQLQSINSTITRIENAIQRLSR